MQEQFELSEEQKKALGEAMDSASSGGGIKTLTELRTEWGLERYVPALGVVTGWLLGHRHPHSIDVQMELLDKSRDAYSVYLCLMMHGANS